MRLDANSLSSCHCLLNSACPWEMISATTWSIASRDISGARGGGGRLRSVRGFDLLPLVMLAGRVRGWNDSRKRAPRDNSSGDVIIWYGYECAVTGVSLSDISSSALLFDSEPENASCRVTASTTALGVGSSNSRAQKGWLSPALPGV